LGHIWKTSIGVKIDTVDAGAMNGNLCRATKNASPDDHEVY